MQLRRLNEATIGLTALGKVAELGRQLNLVTNQKVAEESARKWGSDAQTLQQWGNGFAAFDAVISLTGILAMLQGMRKNRKGAGQAALVQGTSLLMYSLYYLGYSLFAIKGRARLVNVVGSLAHGAAGFMIFRFARRALA